MSCLLISSAVLRRRDALTFKKGQVLGADDEVHDGASPNNRPLVEQSKQDGWFGKKENPGSGKTFTS